MKNDPAITGLLTMAVIVLTTAACTVAGTTWDAVTGATQRNPHTETSAAAVLPPAAETYEVIGILPGLKNYVIRYSDILYRGGAPQSEAAAESLRKLSIRTVISIMPTSEERAFCKNLMLDHVMLNSILPARTGGKPSTNSLLIIREVF